MIEIDTRPAKRVDAWSLASRVFVRRLMAGVLAMVVVGYTSYNAGLLTSFHLLMLPVLIVVTLAVAVIIKFKPAFMRVALGFNGLVLMVYYQGIFFKAAQSHDNLNVFPIAAISQFLPGLYVAIFVLFNRRAALLCWLIYATVVAQCAYSLLGWGGVEPGLAQRQLYWAILAAHPCCIMLLSFTTDLRALVDETQHAAIEAKERFLAMVSHEVRSPLQTIVSSVELFESARTGPAADRAIARMKGAAAVLDTQIRDLTLFTRLELSPDLQLAPIDVSALCREMRQLHQEFARQRGLVLRVDEPWQSPAVMADGPRLRQVIENLLSNALKYTTKGQVTLGFDHEAEGSLHLWVRDTGPGIPPDQVRQVFEPFVRLKNASHQRVEGSGLGLAVVRQLVGLMAGRLAVDSQEGQGTTVHVHLPMATSGPSLPPPAFANRPLRVLVVDDDPSILTSVSELLEKWLGVIVIEAQDGAAAIDLLGRQPVDLALIDLQLPGASGYAVALAARQTVVNRQIPLMAVSAVPVDHSVAGAAAFNAHLSKPFSQADLVREMTRLMA